MFTCWKCRRNREGNPFRIVFFIYDQKTGELTDGYLSDRMLETVSMDICGECAVKIRRAFDHGREPEPEQGRPGRAPKVSRNDATVMQAMYERGIPQTKIAEKFGVSQGTVCRVLKEARRGEQKSSP